MNRLISMRYAEAIGEALRVVPPAIVERLRHVEILTGTDPAWAGLHFYASGGPFSFAKMAHCAYRHQTTDRTTTIVLPVVETARPSVVVHELGHALHEVIGWEHDAIPVTQYARTNRFEAFAESFRAWLFFVYGDQEVLATDLTTLALFDRLAA